MKLRKWNHKGEDCMLHIFWEKFRPNTHFTIYTNIKHNIDNTEPNNMNTEHIPTDLPTEPQTVVWQSNFHKCWNEFSRVVDGIISFGSFFLFSQFFFISLIWKLKVSGPQLCDSCGNKIDGFSNRMKTLVDVICLKSRSLVHLVGVCKLLGQWIEQLFMKF